METIHRAASAATEVLFGEHGEHGQNAHGNTEAGARTDAAGERSHEPLSGRTGNTKIGEPYDAGNLGDETSQQRIAASRGDEPITTGTAGGYTSNTSDTANTSTTATAGGYVPATSSTSDGAPRRSSDISPRSGPAAGTIPIPSTADRHAGGGSYSSARETAARAMSAAETPGSGAGAAAGGAGLWSAGKRKEDVAARDENGYRPGEEGYTGKGAEGGKGQHARFAGERGEADAADVTPSRTHVEGKKVKDVGGAGTIGSTGTGTGAGVGAAGAGAAAGGDAGEGAPLGRRQSLTAHLPGAPGGEGMRRTSGAEGTGEQWVKSSGMKAYGGDFDASAPGAGREADRLLNEKGISRSGADEKKVTGQMDTKAPNGNSGSEGEKLGGLKDKLKNKLHKS